MTYWAEEEVLSMSTRSECYNYLLTCFAGHYGFKFVLKEGFDGAKCIDKMVGILGPNPDIIRQYIDFVFDKIRNDNTKISSLGFFLYSEFFNEFNHHLRNKNKITKQTPLPQNLRGIVAKYLATLSWAVDGDTYEDLGWIFYAGIKRPSDFPLFPALSAQLAKNGVNWDMLQNL